MEDYLVLGIDIGTTNSKGVVVDQRGHLLGEATIQHEVSRPNPGWAEHDPEAVWWGDFISILKNIFSSSDSSPKDICAVGITGMCSTLVTLDRQGQVLRPAILYGIDRRAQRELAHIKDELGEGVFQRITGSPLSTHAILPKLMWLRNYEPQIFRSIGAILSTSGYLVYRLCGRRVMDIPSASGGAGLLALGTLDWAYELFHRFSLPVSILPELGWPSDQAGTISLEASNQTGLSVGTPVVFGSCDAETAALAAGVLHPGEALLVYGSTISILVCLDQPIVGGPFFGGPYCIPGLYKLGSATASAGTILSWYADNFKTSSAPRPYAELDDVVKNLSPGSQGLVLLPYFDGARGVINSPQARGALIGLTMQHDRFTIYHSILEGVAYEIRDILEGMEALGAKIQHIYAVGGGLGKMVWPQIVSNIIGKEQTVKSSLGASMGAAGAAFMAANGVGLVTYEDLQGGWPPKGITIHANRDTTQAYDKYYKIFKQLYRDLQGDFQSLSDA